MKTTLKSLLGVIALCAVLSANALEPKDIRIYINPGHGSWTGGDRAMATVKHGPYNSANPDTTGFFESNTNLRKAFGLLDKLRDYGWPFDPSLNQNNPNPARLGAALDMSQNLVMSHVKCGPYPVVTSEPEASAYNRSLYEIAEEVELNNFDFFISVHSNATTEASQTNFPSFFYRGENATAGNPGSDKSAEACWPYIYSIEHQCWSHWSVNQPYVKADVDFWSGDYAINNFSNGKSYKGYYGVLRHGVPGFLVEGYFHTYQPARHRAMNFDVDRNEGEAYARGLADWFGVAKEGTGDIYGIVRDLHERFKHTYYNCQSSCADALKPINGASIDLLKDGKVIRSYVTDDEYNGAFVFDRLEPGDYFIKVTAPDYKDASEEYCGPITVAAAKTTYPKVYLESATYEPPKEVYEDYPDPVTTEAIRTASEYKFRTVVADQAKEELAGKTVKRLIVHGDLLYVLAHDADRTPTIYTYDAKTLELKAAVSTQGTEGTESGVGDIQVTSDGVLIACAEEICQWDDSYVWTDEGEVRGECNFYYWAKDAAGVPQGEPVKWFSTIMSGNWYHAVTGTTMAYEGSFEEGTMCLSAYSTYDPRKLRNVIIDIDHNSFNDSSLAQPDINVFNLDNLGDNLTYTTSPVDGRMMIVCASKTAPLKIDKLSPGAISAMPDGLAAPGATPGFFRFAGHSLMAVPAVAGGQNVGVELFDVTRGIQLPAAITTEGTELAAEAAGLSAATGRATVVYDMDDIVTEANIDLYLVREGKLSRFTTQGVDQPKVKGAFAYGLKTTVDGNIATLSFNLTADAAATVSLRDLDQATNGFITVASDEFKAGANSVTVDLNTIAGKYSWQVEVDNKAVPTAGRIFTSDWSAARGVVIDRNPESDFYGYVYISDPYTAPRGIHMFTPELQLINEQAYGSERFKLGNTASPYRLAVLPSGRVMAADWSDANGGIWVLDPANPEAGVTNIFNGSLNGSTGEISVDGTIIAGGVTGQWVYTDPEGNRRLYAFVEDYPKVDGNTLVHYNLPADELISEGPAATYPTVSSIMLNTNVNVVATEQGVLVSQVRGSGNNAKGCPSFVIMNHDGEIIFNSGEMLSTTLDGSTTGITLSDDGSLLAVSASSNAAEIQIYRVTWGDEVEMNLLYTVGLGSAGECQQLQFDPAGNLLAGCRNGLLQFSLPTDARTTVTPAKSSDVIEGNIEGIKAVDADRTTDAPAEYYNLQGIRMGGSANTPGFYIKRQGARAEKVLIK